MATSTDHSIWLSARIPNGGLGGIFDIDDLRLGQPIDVTDFSVNGLNGWKLGNKPAENARIIQHEGGHVLNFPTPTGLGYNGVVLSRAFNVMPGFKYKFSFRAQDAVPSARDRARLSAHLNGNVLIPEFTVNGSGWHLKNAEFIAKANHAEIVIFNHTSDGTAGNDLAVSEAECNTRLLS